jgi:hypothetical protein
MTLRTVHTYCGTYFTNTFIFSLSADELYIQYRTWSTNKIHIVSYGRFEQMLILYKQYKTKPFAK